MTTTAAPTAIMLDGCSSSGKSTLARTLQAELPQPWTVVAMDDFLGGMPAPPAPGATEDFQAFARLFATLQSSARRYVADLVDRDVRVILDWVCQGGAAEHRAWRDLLGERLCWVNVHAPLDVLEQRERAREDRAPGMARVQHSLVHQGFDPDLAVDTDALTPDEAAAYVLAHL